MCKQIIIIILANFVFTLNAMSQEKLNQELIHAVKYINIEKVKKLIRKGADINAKDNTQWTPLHWASHAGRKEIAELLIMSGVLVNAQEYQGMTPLHIATLLGYEYIVELLLVHGADKHIKDKDEETAEDMAVRHHKKIEIREILSNYLPVSKR